MGEGARWWCAHLQHLAVRDRRVVAEEVLATVVGLDEAEALGVPPHRHAGRLAVARVVTLTLPIYVTHLPVCAIYRNRTVYF